ncbi:hypothetical protein QR680_011187 [Steinernema hermaphroditum]|uniref:Uncharacterized protein n=1 Tax=Steinernema hermaphroditum TaxID=289476 RepID=A0AA39MD20_9BILA|nr:hypothetical protein QR680_011187 [Steinernema hermaphroditum]
MDLTIENVTRNDGAPVTPSDVFQLLLDEHNSFGKFVLYEHTGITVKHVKNFVKSWIARVHPFRFTSGSIRSDMWSANDLLQLREELLNLAPPVQYARDDSPSRRHRIARRMVYKNGEVLMHWDGSSKLTASYGFAVTIGAIVVPQVDKLTGLASYSVDVLFEDVKSLIVLPNGMMKIMNVRGLVIIDHRLIHLAHRLEKN